VQIEPLTVSPFCMRIKHSIKSHLQWTAFYVSMDLLASPGCYQPDESASLRSAVCAAAGMPPDEAEKAMQQLSLKDPGVLRKLVQQHGNFSAKVIDAELDAILERIRLLEVKVEGMGSKLTLLATELAKAAAQEEHVPLADYLRHWWDQALGDLEDRVPLDKFFKELIQWFKDNE